MGDSGPHQEAQVRAGAGVRCVGAHEGQRQSQALAAHPTHPRDQAHRDGRQCFAGLRVIVRRRAGLQPRPPEGRHVHGHGVIAAVRAWLPLPFSPHLRLPPRQQRTDRPVALPQRRPRPPHRSLRQTTRAQARDHRPPRLQQPATHQHPQQMQQT